VQFDRHSFQLNGLLKSPSVGFKLDILQAQCRRWQWITCAPVNIETKAHCHLWHAVGLFFGLQGESLENGSFLGFGWRLLGILGPRSSNIGLQRLLAMRKAHVLRAFLIQRRKFSETRNAWLTWEDSNFHITSSKNAFEMSGEFPLICAKSEVGDFCSCKLRSRDTHPSPTSALNSFGPCPQEISLHHTLTFDLHLPAQFATKCVFDLLIGCL
jgi:hypothetical protein